MYSFLDCVVIISILSSSQQDLVLTRGPTMHIPNVRISSLDGYAAHFF